MSAAYTAPLRIAPGHPAVPGHFPGNPLVPGVVLLERVAAALQAWRGSAVGKLDAKFVQPLLPGEDATIRLHEDGSRTRFEIVRHDGQVLVRGTLGAMADAPD